MNKNSKKKKVVSSMALGLSLLLAPSLTYRSAINTYAQAALTAEEEAKIQAFLATQPQNNDTTNLGQVTIPAETSNYTFPGINNYTPVIESRASKVHFDKDYEFIVDTNGPHKGKRVKVKDWANVELYNANETSDDQEWSWWQTYYYVKEVTLIDMADGSEFTVEHATFPVDKGESTRSFTEMNYNYFIFDMPIEDANHRVRPNVDNGGWVAYRHDSEYWRYDVPVSETIPYDTIVTIDESLKHGEVEEVTPGIVGDNTRNFRVYLDIPYYGDTTINTKVTADNYKQFTADVIYEDVVELAKTRHLDEYEAYETAWGEIHEKESSTTEAVNRVLRVGIDYTRYVTEDGTELQPKVYGLQGVENFSGYEYVSTRTEANGDRVHVYKKATTTPVAPSPTTPTTPTAPVAQSTPKTGDTNLFTAFAMLISGMIAGAAAFITKKKNA